MDAPIRVAFASPAHDHHLISMRGPVPTRGRRRTRPRS